MYDAAIALSDEFIERRCRASRPWMVRLRNRIIEPFLAIDHVQLAMPRGEEDRAHDFYVDILGMTTLPKPADMVDRGGLWFASGPVALHLGSDPNFAASPRTHVALRCADYEYLIARLQTAAYGVVLAGKFEDGLEHAYLADPFGNRLELVSAAPVR